jgi:hypothetical protein
VNIQVNATPGCNPWAELKLLPKFGMFSVTGPAPKYAADPLTIADGELPVGEKVKVQNWSYGLWIAQLELIVAYGVLLATVTVGGVVIAFGNVSV